MSNIRSVHQVICIPAVASITSWLADVLFDILISLFDSLVQFSSTICITFQLHSSSYIAIFFHLLSSSFFFPLSSSSLFPYQERQRRGHIRWAEVITASSDHVMGGESHWMALIKTRRQEVAPGGSSGNEGTPEEFLTRGGGGGGGWGMSELILYKITGEERRP